MVQYLSEKVQDGWHEMLNDRLRGNAIVYCISEFDVCVKKR